MKYEHFPPNLIFTLLRGRPLETNKFLKIAQFKWRVSDSTGNRIIVTA